jgi:hypothetical protein
LNPYLLSTDWATGINGGHPYPKGSERKDKKAINPESVVVLAHGQRLVVSTLREEDQAFRCSVFEVHVREAPSLAYRVISDGFEALTCLEAQPGAYSYAKRAYPTFADRMKNHRI